MTGAVGLGRASPSTRLSDHHRTARAHSGPGRLELLAAVQQEAAKIRNGLAGDDCDSTDLRPSPAGVAGLRASLNALTISYSLRSCSRISSRAEITSWRATCPFLNLSFKSNALLGALKANT